MCINHLVKRQTVSAVQHAACVRSQMDFTRAHIQVEKTHSMQPTDTHTKIKKKTRSESCSVTPADGDTAVQ